MQNDDLDFRAAGRRGVAGVSSWWQWWVSSVRAWVVGCGAGGCVGQLALAFVKV